ncbi:transcriptional regulator [Hallella multisaccharivorax DSM 17128]|uniref:Histone family protein DNA-binding protein n=1 Tax=Hallella multisaccharivorax DSM 17128 TaxID=688246 RepID=F8NCS7_9BACT|nr:HU family DNA-binding protein [Hallella multisaccharivorax]EGN58112.1 histone family protein DNA-binding protein [Hallella multisaccharivorax DSM 17128]GJG31793.1 transcriptional regulator [Hallella multisaccharivorax DSM 17128]
MNRTELIAKVSERAEISKNDAAKCLNAVLGAIADNLTKGDKELALPDFGRFSVKQVPERKGINPRTKEEITIEAHEKIVFKASDNMDLYSRKHC